MPIYEYECQKCKEIVEVMQKVSDPPPKSHSCGGRKLKRIMSQTSFQLKGSGWYATDYGNKSGGNGKADGKAESKSDDKADSKSGSKSSASTDSSSTASSGED